MHTRRRTVALLAAAATAASLALVTAGSVTGAAHADARTTRLVSTGTPTDATFAGAGGGAVFFRDAGNRVYRNVAGTVSPVVEQPVSSVRVSRDGTALVVVTQAGLTQNDDDGAADAYRIVVATRAAQLISVGANEASVDPGSAEPVTADASRVVYRQNDTTYVVDGSSAPRPLGGPASGSRFVAASSDGTALFYTVGTALRRDIGGQVTPFGDPSTFGASSADGLSGYFVNATTTSWFTGTASSQTGEGVARQGTVIGTSPDLQSIYLLTAQALLPQQDVDGAARDVYRVGRDGSRTLLTGAVRDDEPFAVTPGSITPSGGIVYVYGGRVQVTDAAGAARAVSDPSLGDPQVDAVSSTGRVVWTALDPSTEAARGVYAHESGATTLVAPDATYAGSSADGGTIWFDTTRALTAADTDATRDVYEADLTAAPAPGTVTPTPTTTPTATTPPTAEVDGRKVQQNDGRIEVGVTCTGPQACRVTGTGTIVVTVPSARGRKEFTIKAPATLVSPGQDRVIAFKVKKKVKRAAARSLKNGGKVKATLQFTIADAAGNDRVIAFKVRLK